MEKKTLNLPFIITAVVAIILLSLLVIPKHQSVPKDYELMSAGQLLDVQLGLEGEIKVLVDKKNEVQKLRDSKTASLRGQEDVEGDLTGDVEETPIEQLDSFIENQ